MASTMVIKVKYGEMLRRFTVRIHECNFENNRLDLDIDELREIIFDIFDFSPDADVTLTYIDEDGDTVTLVSDDDLRDVMRQRLKFLRIDVHLKNEKSGKSHVNLDGNSTPASSPQQSLQNVSNVITEVLKCVPEPVPEILAQFFLDFASKTAVTSPILAELAQNFIRFGLPNSRPSTVPEKTKQDVATESHMASPGANSKPLKDFGFHEAAGPKSSFTDLASENCKVINNRNVTKNVGADASTSVDPNVHPTGYNASGCATVSIDGKMEKEVKDKDANTGNRFLTTALAPWPVSGLDVANGSSEPRVMKINGGNCHSEAVENIFHKGVICDGCGAHPITGPRFKSKVKEDYDLCSICFEQMGNVTDYFRIDRPVYYHRHHPRLRAFNRRRPCAGPRGVDVWRSYGKQSKLDSLFIMDVNVLDGTVMAPSTPFTKIWRMHNNGGTVWPRGTQLVWTGGSRFCKFLSVEIEVPADGLPVDKEIDVAIDFTAPAIPGQYISYWKLESPSGERFGQRIWVVIQVETSLGGSQSDSFQALDLNLPPIGSGSKVPEDVPQPMNPTAAIPDDIFFHPSNSNAAAKPVQSDHNQLGNEKEFQFPLNDALLVGNNPSAPAAVEASSSTVSYPAIESHGVLPSSSPQAPSVQYPIIDFSEPHSPAAATPLPKPVPVVSPASSEKGAAYNSLEESLLKELDGMGFDQVELNRDILRKTKYDLELSVEELCGFSEWDHILEELKEMGFSDKEMNRKLLVKNNGSVRRVVMELISGEKA